jgi:hypothetical protein
MVPAAGLDTFTGCLRWSYLLVGVLSTVPLTVEGQGISPEHPVPGCGDVGLEIETSQATYQTWDSVRVRLTLRNKWVHPLRLPAGAATEFARIRVLDAAGSELKRSLAPTPVVALASFEVGPGEAAVLGSPRGEEWISLTDWGYDLRGSGRFTIRSVLSGQRPTGCSQVVESDEVQIAVETSDWADLVHWFGRALRGLR